MKRILFCFLLPALVSIFLVAPSAAQNKARYPDSLKSIVLKIDPLALLYDHFSVGIDVPAGKTFFDLSAGWSDIFSNQPYQDRTGGFLGKAGIKFPNLMRSPLNILYLMPEIAYSKYKRISYDPNNVNGFSQLKKVNATAIMLCLGYRHINPRSKFYYDAGIDMGFGWANHGQASNNYNFVLLRSENPSIEKISGAALSCHFGIGMLVKKKS